MPRQTTKIKPSEQQAFAQRLRDALAASDISVSVTALWKTFNSLSSDPPVTKNAIRKWIMGESIPTQQRMRVLSAWLKVDSNWLRFGEDLDRGVGTAQSVDERMLLKSYRRLPQRERQKLLSLIQTMAIGRNESDT